MISIEQIRAARALLDWSQSDLADHAGLSQTGIARIENGTNQPNSKTLKKIMSAFDMADIEFFGTTGLRKKSGEISTLRGVEGLKQLMTTIYDFAKNTGGEVCLHNAKPSNWIKWLGEDWWSMHSKRMAALQGVAQYKITAEEGNINFISGSFAEYRWLPQEMFNEDSIYVYGNNIAFVKFSADEVLIRILEDQAFAEGFRVLFSVAWKSFASKPVSSEGI